MSGFLAWTASSWYGMELADAASVWLMLWLAGGVFFLLQSSLLNWLGLPAIALLVLLMFFLHAGHQYGARIFAAGRPGPDLLVDAGALWG